MHLFDPITCTPTLADADRQFFDAVLEQVLAGLPRRLHRLLDEVPLIVDDFPPPDVLDRLARARGLYVVDSEGTSTDPADGAAASARRFAAIRAFAPRLCGLYTGVPLNHRSVHHVTKMPDEIRLFRIAIIDVAAHRFGHDRDALDRQIRITLLHEIGHHFGLTESDLSSLGYG